MGAVLQLERFDAVQPPAETALHSAEELQDAYAQGLIAGRAQAVAEQVAPVGSALAALGAELVEIRAAIAAGTSERTLALAPLIGALVDGVLPQLARARLESALLETFVQMAQTVTPLRVAVRCGPDLAPFVSACAQEAGIEAIGLATDGAPGTVTAEMLGGVILWDEAAVVAQLRALVQEVMEDH